MRTIVSTSGLVMLFATLCCAQALSGEDFTHPLGFALIDTTVGDVQEAFGRATVVEEGHHEHTVCYIWPDSHAVITFMSQAEGLCGGFTMEKYSRKPTGGCPTIPSASVQGRKLRVGGLSLGMSL